MRRDRDATYAAYTKWFDTLQLGGYLNLQNWVEATEETGRRSYGAPSEVRLLPRS